MEFIVTVRAKVETLQGLNSVYFLHLNFTPSGVEPTENGDGALAQFKVTPDVWKSVEVGDEIKLGVING